MNDFVPCRRYWFTCTRFVVDVASSSECRLPLEASLFTPPSNSPNIPIEVSPPSPRKSSRANVMGCGYRPTTYTRLLTSYHGRSHDARHLQHMECGGSNLHETIMQQKPHRRRIFASPGRHRGWSPTRFRVLSAVYVPVVRPNPYARGVEVAATFHHRAMC